MKKASIITDQIVVFSAVHTVLERTEVSHQFLLNYNWNILSVSRGYQGNM